MSNTVSVRTASDLCKNIVKRWLYQYKDADKPLALQVPGLSQKRHETWKKLVELEGKGTPEQIAEIIGNTTWSTVDCNLCEESVERVVHIESGSSEVDICDGCLCKAYGELNDGYKLDKAKLLVAIDMVNKLLANARATRDKAKDIPGANYALGYAIGVADGIYDCVEILEVLNSGKLPERE